MSRRVWLGITSTRRVLCIYLCTVSFALLMAGVSGCRDQGTVVIEGPTKVYAEPDVENAAGNRIVDILQPGTKGRVVDVRYSKDFKFYRIRLKDGRTGYVMHGDSFRVE